MPRHPLAFVAALASAVLAATAAGPARSATAVPPPSRGLEKLWSEYPLDQTGPAAETRPLRGGSPPAPRRTDGPRTEQLVAPGDEDPSVGMTILFALIAGVSVVLISVVATKLVAVVRSTSPRARRRRRASHSLVSGSAYDVQLGRSIAVAKPAKSPVESNEDRGAERLAGSASQLPRDDNVGDRGGDYGHIGAQVTTVLTAAEQAAAQIREAAAREAEQIRLDAEQKAEAARAASETLRAEAEMYRDQTRAAADAYAAETRRAADGEAAAVRSALEEEERAARADAERTAKEIEAEALQRRDAMRQSAADLEERIAGMLTAFKGMTSDLEELLPPERVGPHASPQTAEDEAADALLEDALRPERAASR